VIEQEGEAAVGVAFVGRLNGVRDPTLLFSFLFLNVFAAQLSRTAIIIKTSKILFYEL